MRPNSRRASKYRFLIPFSICLSIMAIVIAMGEFQDIVCARTPRNVKCPEVLPLWVLHLVMAASSIPLFISIRQFLLDFYYGAYRIENELQDLQR